MNNPPPVDFTRRFFGVLHLLMDSHPDRELVNQLHRAALESPFRLDYAAAAWGSIDAGARAIRNAKKGDGV